MITKFEKIKNLAVFKDFDWNSSVKNQNGIVLSFQRMNIIYGRNYSGKTTLSRIVRSLETGNISDKYNNPEFNILFSNGQSINQRTISDNTFTIRVFNEDFIKGMRFIVSLRR